MPLRFQPAAGASVLISASSRGAAATIEVGTVTTGSAGSSATVVNSGTDTAAVFDFTIPRGATGVFGGSAGSTDNLGVRADGTGGVTLQAGLFINDDSGNLAPATTDTGALGTTAKMWADLFLASGAVINFNNGNITLTHSAGDVTFAGGTLTLPNTGLHLFDTDSSHDLIIKPGSNITADRTLTVTTGDANRTLTLSGDATLIAGTAVVTAGAQTLTGGFNATPGSVGTKSSGTYTPDPQTDTNNPYVTNGGAHTLAPPANPCSMVIEYTNNGSAGAVTTSGFTKVSGDTITTTNGHKFLFFITKSQTYSHLFVQSLQ